jgi:hypothetical protein
MTAGGGLEVIEMADFLATVAAPGLLSKVLGATLNLSLAHTYRAHHLPAHPWQPLPNNDTQLLKQPLWDYLEGACYVRPWSPGKTFIEPVIAALIVALPTIFYLYNGLFGALGAGQTVRTMPIFMYVIMALIGVMFSLIGSYVGERVQMGAPPKTES